MVSSNNVYILSVDLQTFLVVTISHYAFDYEGKIENMDFVFLLAACANTLADSFPYKYMSCLWLLIWSKRLWGSEYLII